MGRIMWDSTVGLLMCTEVVLSGFIFPGGPRVWGAENASVKVSSEATPARTNVADSVRIAVEDTELMSAPDLHSIRGTLFPGGASAVEHLSAAQREWYAELVERLIDLGMDADSGSNASASPRSRVQQAYERAYAVGGRDPRLLWARSLVLVNQGETAAALRGLDELIRIAPELQIVPLLERASLELENGHVSNSLDSVRKIVQCWPRQKAEAGTQLARQTQARWLGQVLGYLAGSEDPPESALDELRQKVQDSFPESDFREWEREFARVSAARRTSRNKQAGLAEREQAALVAQKEGLRASIRRAQDRERRMQDEIWAEKQPWEQSRNSVLAELRVHNDHLRRLESEAKQLQSRRQWVLHHGLQPTLSTLVVTSPVDQFGVRPYPRTNWQRSSRSRNREDSRSSRLGWSSGTNGSVLTDMSRQMQVEAELNRIDERMTAVRKAAEPVHQQLGAGKVKRQELEGAMRENLMPLKRDLDRVRLDRQAMQKELQRLSEDSRSSQRNSNSDSFRNWRTVSERDLLRELRLWWDR